MKRIVTIQDISGLGKCSLTVALPVISAMGVECSVLPTAVLSTHTMFPGFTFCDLTEEFMKVAEHWQKAGITFDAIYTGYLGSFEQLDLVSRFIDMFRTKDTLVIIDPVMGDNGKLYTGFTPAFAKAMATLCGKADLIIPNLTEATYMLDIPYTPTFTPESIKDILIALCELGCGSAALTGIGYAEGKTGVTMMRKGMQDDVFTYEHTKQPTSFHGTGDLFASVVTGGMMRGLSAEDALVLAANYTSHTIASTMADPTHHTYGVNFEATIPALISDLEKFLTSK